MQQVVLNQSSFQPKIGFWKRQFQEEVTNSQVLWDLVLGVFLPTICFVYDPTVFKTTSISYSEIALFGSYKPFAYILCFVSILAMSVWLIWREKLKWLNAVFAGIFLVGGIVSLGVGIVLFPFSLLGLIILIGSLGFTPLFTSIIYLRNAKRAFNSAKPFLKNRNMIYTILVSIIFSIAVPTLVNLGINHSIDKIMTGDSQTVRAEASKLKYFAPLVNLDRLVRRYREFPIDEKETETAQTLIEVYGEMTGEDLKFKAEIDD